MNCYEPINDEEANKFELQIDELVRDWLHINKLQYPRLHVNPRLMRKVVERVYMRREYYKIFHSDMRISEYKHSALTAYWIVKLKPFWVEIDDENIDSDLEKYTFINEFIALGILVGILVEFNEPIALIGKNLLSQYIEEILYSIKYRDLNKESFIMLLDPYYYLYQSKSLVASDGEAMKL